MRDQAVEPGRDPPVVVAQQLHRCRDENDTDDGGIDEDRGRQAETEHLDERIVAEDETAEHRDHDQGGRGDDPGGRCEAADHRLVAVTRGEELLANTAEQEHLVVHRQAEEDGEHEHRHERHDRDRFGHTDEFVAPSPLEDGDEHAVGGADRQQVEDCGLERHDRRAEDASEQEERQHDHRGDEPGQP